MCVDLDKSRNPTIVVAVQSGRWNNPVDSGIDVVLIQFTILLVCLHMLHMLIRARLIQLRLGNHQLEYPDLTFSMFRLVASNEERQFIALSPVWMDGASSGRYLRGTSLRTAYGALAPQNRPKIATPGAQGLVCSASSGFVFKLDISIYIYILYSRLLKRFNAGAKGSAWVREECVTFL